MIEPAAAAWIAGRGQDVSGVTYLAVVNDAATGERIELNCTPDGQAFLAMTWDAARNPPDADRLTLKFLVGGSHRFAAAAHFRPLDKGWGAAELDAADIIDPLTEVLAVTAGSFEVEITGRGHTLLRSVFDMDRAPESMGLYRRYCRL